MIRDTRLYIRPKSERRHRRGERDVLTFTACTCLTLDLILILNSSFSSKQPTRDDTLKLNLYLHSCQHPEGSGTRCGRSPGVSL